MIQGISVRAKPSRGFTFTTKLRLSAALLGERSKRAVAGTTPNQSSGLAGPYLIGIHGSRRSSISGRSPSRPIRRSEGASSDWASARSSCRAIRARRMAADGCSDPAAFGIKRRRAARPESASSNNRSQRKKGACPPLDIGRWPPNVSRRDGLGFIPFRFDGSGENRGRFGVWGSHAAEQGAVDLTEKVTTCPSSNGLAIDAASKSRSGDCKSFPTPDFAWIAARRSAATSRPMLCPRTPASPAASRRIMEVGRSRENCGTSHQKNANNPTTTIAAPAAGCAARLHAKRPRLRPAE